MDAVRVVVLVCCCLLTFGSYFSYDLPGALTDDFRQELAMNSTAHQGLFYTLYSLPNTVQPFIGGLVIDRVLGLRIGALICASLVAIGCSMVAAAASVEAWSGTSTAFAWALAGRFVFGLGGETLTVCQNAFCANWFRGADLSTAFAVVLSFARVGSAVNFAIEPKVASENSFALALWLSALLCLISLIACVFLAYLDLAYQDLIEVDDDEDDDDDGGGFGEDRGREAASRAGMDAEEGRRGDGATLGSALDTPLLAQGDREGCDELGALPRASSDVTVSSAATGKCGGSVMLALREVLGPRELLIYMICVLFYVGVFVFVAVASKFLVATYEGVDKVSAGLLVSVPYTVSAFVSPFLGFAMDKLGRGGVFVGIACASLTCIHLTFAVMPQRVEPTAMMVWLGLTYSMCAASLWPMIAIVVPSANLSTAYGLMTSIQNVGLALAPAVVMPLVPVGTDADQYGPIEAIFATCALGALGCTVLLYVVDARLGGELFSAPPEAGISQLVHPSPRINPLNPRPGRFRASADARRAMVPKTPQAIRKRYFNKLRIQSQL